MDIVEFLLHDDHPGVRWEAANAVLRFSKRLRKDPLVKKHRDSLLSELPKIAMKESVERVKVSYLTNPS